MFEQHCRKGTYKRRIGREVNPSFILILILILFLRDNSS